jgi:K+-transporting ATPase c subunit
MLRQLAPALKMTLLLTVLTGLVYPGVVNTVCQVLFRNQANGSLMVQNSQVIGSVLLGQNFTKPEYFHPRSLCRRHGRLRCNRVYWVELRSHKSETIRSRESFRRTVPEGKPGLHWPNPR